MRAYIEIKYKTHLSLDYGALKISRPSCADQWIPLNSVGQIFIYGHTPLPDQFIDICSEKQITIHFYNRNADYQGSFVPAVASIQHVTMLNDLFDDHPEAFFSLQNWVQELLDQAYTSEVDHQWHDILNKSQPITQAIQNWFQCYTIHLWLEWSNAAIMPTAFYKNLLTQVSDLALLNCAHLIRHQPINHIKQMIQVLENQVEVQQAIESIYHQMTFKIEQLYYGTL